MGRFRRLIGKVFVDQKSAGKAVVSHTIDMSDQQFDTKVVQQAVNKVVQLSPQQQFEQGYFQALFGKSLTDAQSHDELADYVDSQIRTILNEQRQLLDAMPVMPASIHEIINYIDDPDFDVDKLISMLEQEPFIATKVLSIANSVNYNKTGKDIKDLKSAFMMLGVKGLSEGVLNAIIRQHVPQNTIYFRYYGQKFWEHSLYCASIARQLLKSSDCEISSAQGYMIGLMCNLGDIIIYTLMEEAFAFVHPNYLPNSVTFQKVIDEYGQKLSHQLARHWKLPDSMVEVLRLQDIISNPQVLPRIYEQSPLSVYLYEAKLLGMLHTMFKYNNTDSGYLLWLQNSLYTESAKKYMDSIVQEFDIAPAVH